MPIQKITTTATEADLEAEIHRALARAFPWIAASDLKHQLKFSMKFGHAVVEVDGSKTSKVHARADIIIYSKGTPLAVVELKRHGIAITLEDAEQGLSYARMLSPMPPLVVVTNGTDVRLLETYSGKDWKPADYSDAELAKLIQAASHAASDDVKRAVEILLGTGSDLWVSALRQATALCLKELSGAWDKPLLPFVQDFLISREATQQVLAELRSAKRIVIVEGPPLAGKSNVLRELAVATEQSDDLVVLFVEADSGPDNGLFQRLANLLADKLNWPVTLDEVRNWLRRLSKAQGPALVLAIDGVLLDNDDIRRDIGELCSDTYGMNVRMVISVDDTAVKGLTTNRTGRKASAIGRAAVNVEVKPLSDGEFEAAVRVLWDEHRIGFVPGVGAAAEMRTPWILRAVAAGVSTDPKHKNQNLIAILPPMLGLNLIEYARERFDDPDLRRKVREIAKAVLQDAADQSRPISLILESIGLYLVRDKTLETVLDRGDINLLIAEGVLRTRTHASGEALLSVRLPELLASELALLLAQELERRAKVNATGASEWLTDVSRSLPLGDIVAAQAIFDGIQNRAMGWDLIRAILSTPPREESIPSGSRFAMLLPDGTTADMTFEETGLILTLPDGNQYVLPPDEDDKFGSLVADIHNWLILSHLVLRPLVLQLPDGTTGRIEPALLLEVGTCTMVLRGPQNDPARNSVLTHSVAGHGSIVCHRAGVVEPITMAIYHFLGTNGARTTAWIEEAIHRRSFPLLCRIDIALRQLIDSADRAKGVWAQKVLDDLLKPALEKFPLLD